METTGDITGKLGGKKFILTVVGIVSLLVLVLTHNIDAKEFVAFLTLQIGMYEIANVVATNTNK